ncbi:hypothetical protein PIROE2DRAFT_20846 [Piromyces sp. E2]|nr:hypothetical protein PIROE2DRAFT_20846 [Piromyces sp. E2]|eukprot:OUM62214.1 hypothetical protein PIROE2DRAFT_20846 [Piromyces sp. E2]
MEIRDYLKINTDVIKCTYNTQSKECLIKNGYSKPSGNDNFLCFDDTTNKFYEVTQSTNKCTVKNFNGNVFISENHKLISENDMKVIDGYSCNEESCTQITDVGLHDNKNPGYYIYVRKDGETLTYQNFKLLKYAVYYLDETTLIICKNDSFCSTHTANYEGFYIDGEEKENIIKCLPESNKANDNPSDTGKNKLIKCKREESKAGEYYINSGPDKASNPLIYCDSSQNCGTISNHGNNYYLNADTQNDEVLIYCSNTNCFTIQVNKDNSVVQYYVGTNKEDKILISCQSNSCQQVSRLGKGYYKNSGSDSQLNPLIYCGSSITCTTLPITEPGYYMDASTHDNVFYCKDICVSKDVSGLSSSDIPGTCNVLDNYIVMIGNINDNDNSNDLLYTNGNELFYYLEIDPSSEFPGVTSKVLTLFRVTHISITRVTVDGIIAVNTSHTINLTSTTLTENDTIYKCSKSKMLCEKMNSCRDKMYFLDVNNRTAFKCKDKKLDVISTGYYLDSGSVSTNGIYNHLIYCAGANNCVLITDPLNYYINGGSESSNTSSDSLIYCNSFGCNVVSKVSPGYYLAGVIDANANNNNGYIYCKSANACELKKSLSETYFLNSGMDKNKNALIRCVNGGRCQTITTGNGYFISGNPEELIYCENAGSCSTIKPSSGFYYTTDYGNEETKKIIECKTKTTVVCEKKNADKGYYISNVSNVLINCMGSKCKTLKTYNGIYHSATTITTTTNYKKKRDPELNERNTQIVYNIITCTNTGCTQLSASELAAIPICTFDNNKCFITTKFSTTTSTITSVAAGGYCTNLDHSVIYFATDTIVVDPEIIDGTTSIYTTTTTTSNCLDISGDYSSYYYTINNSIYRLNDGSITQETRSGYYFINVDSNTLASGNIDEYNNPNIKIFKCNDNSCYIVDSPSSTTYYADVNKRIIQYNANSNSFSFPYEKDIICIYENNKCTPNADLKNKEFCITYKGELVLAGSDINSRESGDCYKSSNIVSYIFGYSQFFYEMNSNSAQLVDTTGYYVISLSTNSTASYKDYTNKNNKIMIYGCISSQCKEYKPMEDVYYYDYLSRHMYKYDHDHGEWTTPQTSGYVLASIIPNDLYVYKFSTNMNKVSLEGKAVSGYYYTVDDEMYDCDENSGCEKITDNGYYFTNNGEMYYCLYDSEGLEKTTCEKQNCFIGEYYYIDGTYYRCESGSIYNYISAKYCNYNERIIVNFPTAINNDYPPEIHNAISNISKNNNSTAIINNKINNYLTVIPGIFTNCTYNYEDKTTNFDLVCINNYVTLDDNDNAQICSIPQLGYVECISDESNKEKCNPSSAFSRYTLNTTFIFLLTILLYCIFENIY